MGVYCIYSTISERKINILIYILIITIFGKDIYYFVIELLILKYSNINSIIRINDINIKK